VKGEKLGLSDDTYRVRKQLIVKVESVARPHATIADLPEVLREVKRLMRDTPPSFNQLRQYALACVRDTLGRRHELYQTIKFDIEPIKIPGYAKKKERKRHPLTPAQVLELAAALGDEHGHIAIGLALTGMNPKEYFAESGWEVTPRYVQVNGTKRPGRDRMVPKLFPSRLWPIAFLKAPTVTKHHFEVLFRDAREEAEITCTLLDLRRSFANWMEQAHIERGRRRLYRGHGPGDTGDLYETPEILEHIVGDGARIVAWLDEQLKGPQLMKEARS
jgi:hypothetical protein